MNTRFKTITTVLVLTLGAWLPLPSAVADNIPNRVYELRTYTATEGNLDNLLARFRDHTTRLFYKHGMQVVGYWTPLDEGDSGTTLVYILSHASREAAGKSWRAFGQDPQWQKVAKASNANGPILANIDSFYMAATDFSPLK